MPPRSVTAAIVAFWLATTGALVYEEFKPRFQSGEAPPFTIPLTAEVGKNVVNWHVFDKDQQQIGSGTSQIVLQSERTFELSAKFDLNRVGVSVNGAYRVTEDGKLLTASANVRMTAPIAAEVVFEGEVRDKMFHPKLAVLIGGIDVNPFPAKPFEVSDSGSVLNPMHLVHKIAGLRDGQSWRIPLMDPRRALPSDVKDLLPGNINTVNHVVAKVSLVDLEWHKNVESCFKIEYAKPGERTLAATWVRRSDDAVLQQWASYEGIEYTLQRVPGD